MPTKLSLVILAGGLGSRYRDSKQIAVFGPQKAYLLEFALYDAVQAGFSQAVIIVNERVIYEMKEKMNHWNAMIHLVFVVQQLTEDKHGMINPLRTKPWGTAHAVLCAAPFVSGPFVVMNADDYYGQSIMMQAANFLQNDSASIGLIAFPIGLTLSENGGVSRGICEVSETQELMRIQECHEIYKHDGYYHSKESVKLTDATLVSMNFWLFPPSIFTHLLEFFEVFFRENHAQMDAECYLPNAIQFGINTYGWNVNVLEAEENWIGLTFPEDKKWVEASVQDWTLSKKYPLALSHE